METAFGIVLFLLVYGPVAYMVYDEVTGRRAGFRLLRAGRAGVQRSRQSPGAYHARSVHHRA
jgi:hypothetical protein